jgi:hypothetical protein
MLPVRPLSSFLKGKRGTADGEGFNYRLCGGAEEEMFQRSDEEETPTIRFKEL